MAPMTIMELPCVRNSAVGQIQGIWLHTILYFCIVLRQKYHQAHTHTPTHTHIHILTHRQGLKFMFYTLAARMAFWC